MKPPPSFFLGSALHSLAGRRQLLARRKLWLAVHLWLGLGLGAFLSIFGITGAVLVFHEQIDRLAAPGYFAALSPANAPRAHWDQVFDTVRRVAPPGAESGGISLPADPAENISAGFWIEGGTAEPEGAVSLNIAIDPATAEPVARRVFYHRWNPLKHCLVGFFFKLHYALLLGDFGVTLVGVLGVLSLVSVLSGLILWWPLDGKWRRVLTLKAGASRVRFIHDLHQSAGFYSLLVLLAVLVSGLYFNLPDQFRWLVDHTLALTPDPVATQPLLAGQPGTSIDAMLAKAQARYPGGRLSFISWPDPKTGVITACLDDVPSLTTWVVDSRCLLLDARSGALLKVNDPSQGSAGDTFMLWQWPLHSGRAFGWPGRILVALAGLVCPLLFVTGLLRWQNKRHAKRCRQPSR